MNNIVGYIYIRKLFNTNAGTDGKIVLDFCRLLMKTPGFLFEERSRSCLPVGFPEHISGTCHFLLSYAHSDVSPDNSEDLDAHVAAGMRQLTLQES